MPEHVENGTDKRVGIRATGLAHPFFARRCKPLQRPPRAATHQALLTSTFHNSSSPANRPRTMEVGMQRTDPEPKWNTLPKAGCVNRRCPPPAFLVALRLSFSNAGSEPLLCRRFETEMLLRHGPVYNNSPDRRAMRRFSMRLPASVRVPGIPNPFATDS